MKKKKRVIDIRHPLHTNTLSTWSKWRYVMNGGSAFIEKYVKKLTFRESDPDFDIRKEVSYCAAHAKAAVYDVRDLISRHLPEVIRHDGPKTYHQAVAGETGGIDTFGSTMTNYMSSIILPELLFLSKVGIYVDREPLPEILTKADENKNIPYIYIYPAEDILSWQYTRGVLTAILLRHGTDKIDEDTGLIMETESSFRLIRLLDGRVHIQAYDKSSKKVGEELVLNIPQIPISIATLATPLLTDVADYQISHTNLASADLYYALKANYPFYTEQKDARQLFQYNTQEQTAAVPEDPALTAEEELRVKSKMMEEVQTGGVHGRTYLSGLDRPKFIHPSPEPLLASMKKQDILKQEIRELLNYKLRELGKRTGHFEETIESGLVHISEILQQSEFEISYLWGLYTSEQAAKIVYPDRFDVESTDDRLDRAERMYKFVDEIPSKTFRHAQIKHIIRVLTPELSKEDQDTVDAEIDASQVAKVDAESIATDHEAGFVSTATASQLRGYDSNEVEQATKDHAERLARIAAAQAKGTDRGVPDTRSPEENKLDKVKTDDDAS